MGRQFSKFSPSRCQVSQRLIRLRFKCIRFSPSSLTRPVAISKSNRILTSNSSGRRSNLRLKFRWFG